MFALKILMRILSNIDGEYDHLPEPTFYMIGSIEEAEKEQKLYESKYQQAI